MTRNETTTTNTQTKTMTTWNERENIDYQEKFMKQDCDFM